MVENKKSCPNNLISLNESIIITIEYKDGKYNFGFYKKNDNVYDGEGKATLKSTQIDPGATVELDIENESVEPFEIKIKKKDNAGKARKVTFDVTYENIKDKSQDTVTTTNGNTILAEAYLNDYSKSGKITLKEQKTNGLEQMEDIVIEVKYNANKKEYTYTLKKNAGGLAKWAESETSVSTKPGETVELDITNNISPFDLKIHKTDTSGNNLTGISFKAELTENIAENIKGTLESSYETNSGYVTIEDLKLEDYNKVGKITIKELQVNGYTKLKDLVIYVKYSQTNGYQFAFDENFKENTSLNGAATIETKCAADGEIELTLKNKEELQLSLSKFTSETGNKLNNTTFDFAFENATATGTTEGYKPNTDEPISIVPTDAKKNIKITITEKKVNDKIYSININKIYKYEMKYEYSSSLGKGIWKIVSREIISSTGAKLDVFVVDTGYVKDGVLYINAYNDINNDTNIKAGNVIITGNVWKEAQQRSKDPIPAGDGEKQGNEENMPGVDVVLTGKLTTYEPTYKYRYYAKTATANKDDAGNTIYNITFKTINENKGNSYKENNITYYLYREEFAGYTEKVENISKSTQTDENGNYKFEMQLPTYEGTANGKEITKYSKITDGKVTFKYNGVQYQATIKQKDSDTEAIVSHAEEDGDERDKFNEKFSTVNLQNTLAQDAYGNYIEPENNLTIGKSEIDISNNGKGKHGSHVGKADYQMNADTDTIEVTANGQNQTITKNLGLLPRGIDIEISSQVYQANISINGKDVTYDYNAISEGALSDVDLNKLLDNNKKNAVPVNIYPTDYYYRIDDYNENELNNTDSVANIKGIDELKVFVTYKVELIGRTTTDDLKIKEIAYYYDSNYNLIDIYDDNRNRYNKEDISDKLSKISGANGIKLSGEWSAGKNLYFKFEIPEITNKQVTNNELANLNHHVVTITSYSTSQGLLDVDSAIKNISDKNPITSIEDIQFEDDTAASENVLIKLSSESRTVSGNVFEDMNLNAKIDDDEKIATDVIVQLIEIAEESGNEYIWQETKAVTLKENETEGIATVKSLVSIDKTGQGLYEYTIEKMKVGEYKFKDIVPGNYIIRFIYGDGYYYDITPNNAKYNGVDYRSTKDDYYDKPYYNEVMYEYSDGASVARDNEARRLEVMAETVEIDSGLGTALEVYANNMELKDLTDVDKANIKKYLNSSTLGESMIEKMKQDLSSKTFMVADTSKVNMPVDTNTLKTSDKSTTVTCNKGYVYDKIDINFENVNFGLMKKPEVKLALEKHITALKITPTGTGMQAIVDARANINDIINNGKINPEGMTQGLSTGLSTRTERGYWWEATDEELAQGANVEVEYTYKVTNASEQDDYISEDLIEKYNESTIDDYKKYLESKVNEAKAKKSHEYGTILGAVYYTMQATDTTAKVEAIEEALNPRLSFDEAQNDKFKVTEENLTKKIIDTSGTFKDKKINQIVTTKNATANLIKGATDVNNTIKLTGILNSQDTVKDGNIYSYIAEITKYTSASGGRNTQATPGNLTYVHSEDSETTLENAWLYDIEGHTFVTQEREKIPENAEAIRKANEIDEFWGETIIASKPTGEDKSTNAIIIITTVISVAVLAVGIVLIKKYALKK